MGNAASQAAPDPPSNDLWVTPRKRSSMAGHRGRKHGGKHVKQSGAAVADDGRTVDALAMDADEGVAALADADASSVTGQQGAFDSAAGDLLPMNGDGRVVDGDGEAPDDHPRKKKRGRPKKKQAVQDVDPRLQQEGSSPAPVPEQLVAPENSHMSAKARKSAAKARATVQAAHAAENALEELAPAPTARMTAEEEGGVVDVEDQDYQMTAEDVEPEDHEYQEDGRPKKRKGSSLQSGGRPSKRNRAAEIVTHFSAMDPEEEVDEDSLPTYGPFNEIERRRVERFARAFCEAHDLMQDELNNLVQNKERRMDDTTKSFWSEIYGILPRREKKAMQRHVRRRFHNYVRRGKWTPEEDEALQRAYDEKPNRWKHIGEAMFRMPEDCRDRWRNYLVCGDQRRVDTWTEKEEMDLSMAVHECMEEARQEAKAKAKADKAAFREDQDWESKVNFNIVSDKMGHARSRIQCLQHWKSMNDREAMPKTPRPTVTRFDAAKAPRPGSRQDQAAKHYKLMLPGDKFAILQEIVDSDSYSEERIPWSLITQRSTQSNWTTADRKYAFGHMKLLLPESHEGTLGETVSALLEHFEKNHGRELDQFFQGVLKKPSGTPKKRAAKPKQPRTPATATRPIDETDDMLDPMLQDEDAAAILASTATPLKAPPSTKRGRRSAKKAGKQFKSADRIAADDDDDNDENSAAHGAPQANMLVNARTDNDAEGAAALAQLAQHNRFVDLQNNARDAYAASSQLSVSADPELDDLTAPPTDLAQLSGYRPAGQQGEDDDDEDEPALPPPRRELYAQDDDVEMDE